MPDAVKSVLADVSSVSPWLRQSKGERKVDVDMLDAVKSVLAAQSSTLRWYRQVRFTATPTQTKTSSHRD